MTRNLILGFLSASLLATAVPKSAGSERGRVEKVDAATGTVTLKHEAIPKLGVEAMPMGFPVLDPSMSQGLEAEDPVTFDVAEAGCSYTINRIREAT